MIATLRHRDFALLWFGGLISETGDWLLIIGLPVYVYTLTGSTVRTGVLFLAEFVPSILLGSVAGVFVDRWDRRRTMLTANVLQALFLLPLLAVHSPSRLWIVYAVAFVESIVAQFFVPAQNALLPNLVDEAHVLSANSLVSLGNNLSRLIGSPVGGFVVGLFGLRGVVLLDAVSFVVSAGMIDLMAVRDARRRTAPLEGGGTTAWSRAWKEWLRGLEVIRRSSTVVVLFVIAGIQACAQGIFLVLYVVFVLKVLRGGAAEVGWLRGVQAVGGLLGGALVGWIGSRIAAVRLVAFGLVGFGILDLGIWNSPMISSAPVVPATLFVLVGIPGMAFVAGMNTLLQTSVADQYRGRVFGSFLTASSLLQLTGMALATVLGDPVGVVRVLNAQACMYLLAGVIAIGLLGRQRAYRPAPQPDRP